MSQRRRFYDALTSLISIEDWRGLEYIEQAFDKKRGEILARCVCELRGQDVCMDARCPRVFDVAFGGDEIHVID